MLIRTTALLAAVLLLLAGCSDVGGTGDLEYVQGEGSIREVDTADRDGPVDIAGESLEGESIDVGDLRGQVVVMNVWGSWCTPCRAEMPILVGAAEELEESAPDEVAFVGINIRDPSVDEALAFEREFDVEYPSIHDPGSEQLLAFGRLAPYAPPSTVILDREGRVATLITGAVPSQKTLVGLVEDLLGGAEDDGGPADG